MKNLESLLSRHANKDKWFNYYRYFYFDEDMPFFIFMRLVKFGRIPKREAVDWSKVKGVYES